MEKKTIGDKWCIKPQTTEQLESIYNKVCLHSEAKDVRWYYHHPAFNKCCYATDSPRDGYTEITFDEFKKHILGEKKQVQTYEIY